MAVLRAHTDLGTAFDLLLDVAGTTGIRTNLDDDQLRIEISNFWLQIAKNFVGCFSAGEEEGGGHEAFRKRLK